MRDSRPAQELDRPLPFRGYDAPRVELATPQLFSATKALDFATTLPNVPLLCHGNGMAEPPHYAPADFVSDPETGTLFVVEHTDEYSELLATFNSSHCKHPERQVFRHKTSNGAVQVRECCVSCGQGFGSAMSQKDKGWVAALPWLPDSLEVDYFNQREKTKRALLLALGKKQHADRGSFTNSYTAYLASPQWQAKRSLVLKRCGGVCEGCGLRPATEVHHHHYDHLFDELLFELAGLCNGCHQRITQERREYREASLQKAMEQRRMFASSREKETADAAV